MQGLEGRTALVTGAAGGIGRAVVEVLAANGVNVAVTDVSVEQMEPVVEAARSCGVSATACVLDVASPQAITAAVQSCTRALGSISLGVTGAGVLHVKPALELEESEWDRTFDVNLKGTFFVLQALAGHMTARGTGGRLVAVSSVGGRSGRPELVDYAASKAGVISVVRSLALALAPLIRVNAVCPGVVDTAMTTALHAQRSKGTEVTVDESIAAMAARIPLGEIADPRDIARAVAFLLSDSANQITGQSINVCGGLEFD